MFCTKLAAYSVSSAECYCDHALLYDAEVFLDV